MSFDVGSDASVFLSAFGPLAGGDLATSKMPIGSIDDRVSNTLDIALELSHRGPPEIS